MELIFIIVFLGVFIVFSSGMLFREYLTMRGTVKSLAGQVEALTKENAGLKAKVEVLEQANRKHLPYDKLEDLEHAKAAWIALVSDLEIKQHIVENLGVWLDRAREDKRKKA